MTCVPAPLTGLDAVTVRPGPPLAGTVRVDGSKNAALPLLATAATMRRTVHLSNVPASTDVQGLLTLLQSCGVRIARPVTDPATVIVLPATATATATIPVPDLPGAGRLRASYYLVPALLAACGQAVLPWPGGCPVGDRGMDVHFAVYRVFGDTVALTDTHYTVTATSNPRAAVSLTLPFRSRGATAAALLRAVAGGVRLRLGNPSLCPEVLAVLDALSGAGWAVEIGEDRVVLEPAAHSQAEAVTLTVPGDKIEAGTLACAVAATGGSGRIEGIDGRDVTAVVEALTWLGIPATAEPDAVTVRADAPQLTGRPLRIAASLAPDGVDADFEPALLTLALGMPGTHLFADAINPGRHHNLLPQLGLLGARIDALSPTQCRLAGPQRLTGATVRATDIRTGSALLLAALTADGTTTVTGLEQLRRGHADLPAKLRALGADITEVPR
ncbi:MULTISPECIES: UDP-N-acetylglucosamine 1-carboxyvinyltransferase [unclassified Streptomyces]|uniref:UDP-N-acetylglucosamine 1-carboxyvinyltransferase n=1 Tax=unclassified Streptomyces TaxID=2593676 RepID=UPI0013C248AB|nr:MULTISPECIES: UDP-N-acetylglucosamine 1-carboxyvinyltransferase [unclassified Streptomyces]MCZ4118681.1 UDP-N-acetylglucosamine 1-carboxyvinyltransferase [Streptomyces sp. H39-S7]NEA60180.1 UDP-N-acetylglucosamine 1-carboxyvinyltransferase [Streptomyces sp. SID13666]NEA74221.1 UDP-N-acetylglucosamine 1-carboxyvinyltransferase [Streptomyces sp. SID13588]